MVLNEYIEKLIENKYPAVIIASIVADYLRESKNGDYLSFDELWKISQKIHPNGYVKCAYPNYIRHKPFTEKEIEKQIASFKENIEDVGLPLRIIDMVRNEWLQSAKHIDALPLDSIYKKIVFEGEDEEGI